MLAGAAATLAMLALAGGARACELDGLFGLQFGEAVPQQLVLKKQEQLGTYTDRHGCRFRQDRAHIAYYPDFRNDDSEVHVSTGSKSIAIAQRDGARVVLRLRSLRTLDIVKQDPPKD